MRWHPWDLGESPLPGAGRYAQELLQDLPSLFSLLGQEGDATPGYLKAGVP